MTTRRIGAKWQTACHPPITTDLAAAGDELDVAKPEGWLGARGIAPSQRRQF